MTLAICQVPTTATPLLNLTGEEKIQESRGKRTRKDHSTITIPGKTELTWKN